MQISVVCSICNKDRMVITEPESGEIICSACGAVMLERIQEDLPEWRAFNLEEANDRSRTGAPFSLALHDMGLFTIIGKSNKDARGKMLNSSAVLAVKRLRIWDARTQFCTSSGKSLKHAFDELNNLKDKLGLSEAIIEKAAYIYRKALDKGLTRGRTRSSIILGSIYIACRELQTPRTLNDIAAVSNAKRNDLARTYRLLLIELDLKVPLIDPLKYVIKIGSRLNLSEKTKRKAIKILNDTIKTELSAGKAPLGLAATAICLACRITGENRSQVDIANASGVTDVTIRNRYKDMKNFFNQ